MDKLIFFTFETINEIVAVHAPAKVGKPKWASQHPRGRAKEQAAKMPLALFSPTHKKNEYFKVSLLFLTPYQAI